MCVIGFGVILYAAFAYFNIGINSASNADNYNWETEAYRSQYHDIQDWSQITTSRLSGLQKEVDSVEELQFGGLHRDRGNPECDDGAIRKSRRMLGIGNAVYKYCLRVEKDGNISYVTSTKSFRSMFAPVDTAEEAISFIAVVNNGLKLDDSNQVSGYVSTQNGKFVVRIIAQDQDRCGEVPQEIVYVVSESGDINRVAIEKNEKEPPSCPLPA